MVFAHLANRAGAQRRRFPGRVRRVGGGVAGRPPHPRSIRKTQASPRFSVAIEPMPGLAAEVRNVDRGERIARLDQEPLARRKPSSAFRAFSTGSGQARPRRSSWRSLSPVILGHRGLPRPRPMLGFTHGHGSGIDGLHRQPSARTGSSSAASFGALRVVTPMARNRTRTFPDAAEDLATKYGDRPALDLRRRIPDLRRIRCAAPTAMRAGRWRNGVGKGDVGLPADGRTGPNMPRSGSASCGPAASWRCSTPTSAARRSPIASTSSRPKHVIVAVRSRRRTSTAPSRWSTPGAAVWRHGAPSRRPAAHRPER